MPLVKGKAQKFDEPGARRPALNNCMKLHGEEGFGDYFPQAFF
jgi:hypothetical protein